MNRSDPDASRSVASLPARNRGTGPNGVRFWIKPFVRWYILVLTTVLVTAIAISLLVLAGGLNDATWLRVVLVAVIAMALATLLVRINATKPPW